MIKLKDNKLIVDMNLLPIFSELDIKVRAFPGGNETNPKPNVDIIIKTNLGWIKEES